MAATPFTGTLHYNLLKYDGQARAWKRIPQSRPFNFDDVKGHYAKDAITNQEGLTWQTYAEITNIKLLDVAGVAGVDTSMISVCFGGSETNNIFLNKDLIPANNKEPFANPIPVDPQTFVQIKML